MICDGTAPCMIRSKTSKTHNGWFGHCFRARNPADSVLAALIDFELSAWGVFVNNLSPFCIRVGVAEALTKCRDCLGQEGGDGCFEVHCLFCMIEWFWWKWNGKRGESKMIWWYFASKSSKKLSFWACKNAGASYVFFRCAERWCQSMLSEWETVSDLLVFFEERFFLHLTHALVPHDSCKILSERWVLKKILLNWACRCRRIYKNKINTHNHLKIRKFPLSDEIHVLIEDFVYSREFENNTHISRLTYLSFSKTSYLRMVWYIGGGRRRRSTPHQVK